MFNILIHILCDSVTYFMCIFLKDVQEMRGKITDVTLVPKHLAG